MMKMMQEQQAPSHLGRSSSSCLISTKITPSNFSRSTSTSTACDIIPDMPLVPTNNYRNATGDATNTNDNNNSPLPLTRVKPTRYSFTAFVRSLFRFFAFPPLFSTVPACRWMSIPNRMLSLSSPTRLGRKVTGTLFGHRKGHVTFTVQEHPRADPAIIIELAISTSALVREMSSGLVRIALECEKTITAGRGKHAPKLFLERAWTVYCNGRKSGHATTRACTDSDCHVLGTIQSVSVGAGVIPSVVDENRVGSGSEGELVYMRARFERVVGSRDSEAFYMLNPDGNGGPELSIFLLRL